ncbi:MAG: DNA mismatch repair endonuclease MutL [Chloroflexi bacterium]|nr:DNA mismatch repair endonuclease MutL [Chloroflexota bacterium]
MPIELLPEEVIGRIAAGEAIERPASAAKELIENAIDAGASSVHVEVEAGGRRTLRVTDDGTGIHVSEIELAFKRHATSKLTSADDLRDISTLGFRGEALASIAAVSRATVVTRHRDDEMGVSLNVRGGVVEQRRLVGAPAGTVVAIENLFFNTPARLAFLKSEATEKRHIQWVVMRYAMAYPNIAFALKQDGRERFRSSGGGVLADVLANAFGLKAFRCMMALDGIEERRPGRPAIGITGYVSQPTLSRASRDRIILFVNGRAIQDSTLSHAITQAYDGLLKTGAFPFAVLLISMPPDFVDVNVHPTKAEVRFRDSQLVFVAVQRAVRETLLKSSDAAPAVDLWTSTGFGEEYISYQHPQPPWRQRRAADLFDDEGMDHIPEAAEAPMRPRTLPVLRVVGQVGASYIIAEGPAGLYLIDQNAAHERVLYHQLIDESANGGVPSQALPESQTALLAPDDAQLLCEVSELFTQLNFEIEVFGPNSFLIRRAPRILSSMLASDVLPRMLASLRGSEKTAECAAEALAAVAAVRNGQMLQEEEMQSLIAQLERCPSPFASPSGRKTLIHLSREDLADEFKRL